MFEFLVFAFVEGLGLTVMCHLQFDFLKRSIFRNAQIPVHSAHSVGQWRTDFVPKRRVSHDSKEFPHDIYLSLVTLYELSYIHL